MADGRVRSRERSAGEGIVLGTGAEGLFTFPWPGPGNSEGPVDPDRWSVQPRVESFASGSGTSLLATSPWPGPGNSEA
jgi:hypothetical protein